MFFGCRMMPVKTANKSLNTIIQRQVKCLVEKCIVPNSPGLRRPSSKELFQEFTGIPLERVF